MDIKFGSPNKLRKVIDMKFHSIFKVKPKTSKDDAKISFINQLLTKKIFNDHIFENYFIFAICDLDSPIQLYYRLLWTELYLKQPVEYFNLHDDNQVALRLSLSECVKYIQTVTPPAMLDKVNQQMSNVDDIVDLMKFYLIDETDRGLKAYNLTTFYSVFHTEVFETNFKPDFKKIAFVRDRLKQYSHGEILGLIDASTASIQSILKSESREMFDEEWIQMTFHVDTEDDLHMLYPFLYNNHFRICDLHCEDIGLFVSAYADTITPDIVKMIQVTYSQLLGA